MRDRLIKLIKQAKHSWSLSTMVNCDFETWIANYLLVNGVIVPPCKVGDTVYELYDMQGCCGIAEHIVTNVAISINPTKCVVYTKNKQYEKSKDIFYDDKFGITLFFTREEAEKVLEVVKNGN